MIRHDKHTADDVPWRRLRWLLPLALILFVLSIPLENIWLRMGVINLVLVTLAWRFLPLPWRQLWLATGRQLLAGAGLGVALYLVGGVGFRLLIWLFPGLAAQAASLYSWADQLPRPVIALLLPLIVAGEEIFWRAGVTLPLAARFGPAAAALLSGATFALAHVFVGPPLLWLAALVFGTIWAGYLVAGRRLAPVFVCHLVWDILAMFLLPYSAW